MGIMSQKDLAQQGARRINEFQAETKRNKAQATQDEADRVYAQNHPDPTKVEEGLGDPMAMFTPLAGDIMDVGRAVESATQGDWSGAALSMAAAIPFVGDGLKAGLKSRKKIKGQEGSATTQVATTAGSYKKAVAKAQEINPNGKTVLDYGAGLGLGTDAMRETSKMKVTSYEPFPERWKGDKPVDYTDSAKINTKFDTVVNLNVLNVLEPELRAVVAKDLMSKVKEGGVAIVGTRGWKGDVNAAKKATAATEDKALWIHKSSGDVYQKGFDGNELKDYMAKLAPEGYRVERGKGIANNTVYVFNENKSGYNEGGLVDEMDSVDDFTLDGGLPKAAAPYEGDRAALDAAVIEMRRIEADGPNPTFYAKDDQDFTEYGGIEEPVVVAPSIVARKPLVVTPITTSVEPVVATPSVAIDPVEEPFTEAVVQTEAALNEAAPATFDTGMMDWFASTEGTETATVNGTVTYPYGVEEGKFQGVDREAYKNKDGTYRDREFATAVFGKHKATLKKKHPQWDTYPLGVKEALASYKWNYGLGNNVVNYAVAAAKLKDPTKRKAMFKKSMTSMLDTFGAKDTAKGADKKGAMTGLVKRRAADYNRAADDLGYTKIASYSLSNKGTGAEAVYKDAAGNVISTQKSTYKIHTNNKAVTDKSLARVDKTDWDNIIV